MAIFNSYVSLPEGRKSDVPKTFFTITGITGFRFLQQRLQEDLASLEDAVGRIGDFHEEPSRWKLPGFWSIFVQNRLGILENYDFSDVKQQKSGSLTSKNCELSKNS
jgi:hypothetical protein